MSDSDIRLTSIELVLHKFMGVLEIHGAKLDAILEAATKESGPSETALLLKEIVAGLTRTTEMLEDLPANIAALLREEIERDDGMEPAEGADFEGNE